MVEINRNLTWQDTKVTRHDRSEMNQHESFCLWFTGLSGSGKSTIATAVERSLHLQGIRTYLLDGDNVRHGLCSDLGFSAEDRKENIRRIAQVAGLMVDGGSVVIVAAISPNQQDRQMAREVFQNNDFVEIFVDCPVDVCMQRDPKGLYEKAVKGEIPEFTGISSPYDVPLDAEIHLDSGKLSIEDSVKAVLAYIQEHTQKVKIQSVV